MMITANSHVSARSKTIVMAIGCVNCEANTSSLPLIREVTVSGDDHQDKAIDCYGIEYFLSIIPAFGHINKYRSEI